MHGLFLTSRRHWWERVNSTVIESHLSVTSGSSRERTPAARFIDRDANDCAISPPREFVNTNIMGFIFTHLKGVYRTSHHQLRSNITYLNMFTKQASDCYRSLCVTFKAGLNWQVTEVLKRNMTDESYVLSISYSFIISKVSFS